MQLIAIVGRMVIAATIITNAELLQIVKARDFQNEMDESTRNVRNT